MGLGFESWHSILLLHGFFKTQTEAMGSSYRSERMIIVKHGSSLLSYLKHRDEFSSISKAKTFVHYPSALTSKATF